MSMFELIHGGAERPEFCLFHPGVKPENCYQCWWESLSPEEQNRRDEAFFARMDARFAATDSNALILTEDDFKEIMP